MQADKVPVQLFQNVLWSCNARRTSGASNGMSAGMSKEKTTQHVSNVNNSDLAKSVIAFRCRIQACCIEYFSN